LGDKIPKKDTTFRKTISVQVRLALTLRFLASGDSYVSLQHLLRISKQTISCIVPEVCEAVVEKLKDYVQVRQIFFVVYEISLKLDCNQNFYTTAFTETLLLKVRPNYSKSTCILISFCENVVACEVLSVGKL
jgi:hypothetical protein